MTQPPVFRFGTKAETLLALKQVVETAAVLETRYFSVDDWARNRATLLSELGQTFGEDQVVVRSSALAEDGDESSMAGQFDSLLSIPASDAGKLAEAVDHVAGSMSGNPRDQVLVQTMARDVTVSGVIMTYDVARGAPYYCIDYDDETGRTDVVTSGSGLHKSLYVHRDADMSLVDSDRIQSMLRLARELEKITGHPALDIEFGLTSDGVMYLFQVRRIVLAKTWHPVTDRRVKRHLSHIEDFLSHRMRRRQGILGERNILAIMPDWNPAEIIGTTPKPLSRSLYAALITNRVWASARAKMGYRDLGETELMVTVGHHPYIDVRNSFNSFLPAALPDPVGERLVNAWLARLAANPEFHDKIEFQIVPTCLDFSFDQDFPERYPDLLTADELAHYRGLLRDITLASFQGGENNSLNVALSNAASLAAIQMPDVPETDGYANLQRADQLLKLCRRQGTEPFAIAARHGFIAEALLRSATARGALSPDRLQAFKRSIRTVSGAMLSDFAATCDGRMTQSDFFARYGHLRPGTYEITSLRYDERSDLFNDTFDQGVDTEHRAIELTARERTDLESLLAEIGLEAVSVDHFLDHAGKAIAARESVKFDFTRTLSDALLHIQRWGFASGLSRKDVSYLEWPTIAGILSNPVLDDLDRHFLSIAQANIVRLKTDETLKFGHIFTKPSDIYVATMNRSVPNFIGFGAVQGKTVVLDEHATSSMTLEGRIVCIENADPGFDWIFTKSPLALATRFGGANSHMAVRCAELGIPAAIGCGDQIFNRIAAASHVEMDCKQQILRPVHGG